MYVRNANFFYSFSFKNYSHLFNTKSRVLKIVKQAFVRLTFGMNPKNFPSVVYNFQFCDFVQCFTKSQSYLKNAIGSNGSWTCSMLAILFW